MIANVKEIINNNNNNNNSNNNGKEGVFNNKKVYKQKCFSLS